ncbi:MAG: TetR/AcrR family transcriptional regulator [Verrucomicrobiota bacterium]
MSTARAARKTPAQHRSRETVDVILTAAARIFAEHGWAGANTNRIAEAAGVSVGSLYQYYPGKLALLAALKERWVAGLLQQLAAALDAPGDSVTRGLRRAIRTTLAYHGENRALLLLFAEELPVRLHHHAGNRSHEAPHLAMLRRFFTHHRRTLRDRDPALAALVVGEMVDAVTRSALRDRPADVTNGRLEAELLDVCRLYLHGR